MMIFELAFKFYLMSLGRFQRFQDDFDCSTEVLGSLDAWVVVFEQENWTPNYKLHAKLHKVIRMLWIMAGRPCPPSFALPS